MQCIFLNLYYQKYIYSVLIFINISDVCLSLSFLFIPNVNVNKYNIMFTFYLVIEIFKNQMDYQNQYFTSKKKSNQKYNLKYLKNISLKRRFSIEHTIILLDTLLECLL